MGVLRAGFNGTVGQSSAQVIDGSLKFNDDNKQFLKKTFSSGNSRTWTWSAWIRRDNFGSDHRLFTSDADANNQGGFKFIGDQIQFFSRKSGTFNINLYTAARFRDTGWYHMMVVVDTTIASPSTDRVKIYVNGVLQSIDSSYNTYPSQNYGTRINTNIEHVIGRYNTSDSQYMNGAMSQCYLIDGQALGPEYFGFTDGLTGTWRPKKYTGSFTSTRSEDATLNTSFATTPPTDSTGTTTLTTQNISTQTASTNSFGVTTSTLFSGTSHYSRVLTNASVGSSAPFTIDFIAKFVQSGSSSYFCEFASGNAIIQTDNPAANTNCLLWGAHTFSMSYGWHSIRVQWDGSRSKLWVDGTLTLNITNAPGASNGNMTIGAHPTQDIRTFNGEFGPFRLTPAALGAPKSGGLDASDFADSTTFDNPNSFYLPMDGNSPIGQDKSGNGNDWTPVNFGGSNSLEKATGALPILNTTPGGVSASVGVRTDANASSLALALPLASDLNAVTNQINSGASNRTILSHNSPVSSTSKFNFYGRSYYLSGSQAITIGAIGTDLQFGSDDFTMEIWFNGNTTLDTTYWNPIVSFPWHGNNNENSQIWIGFAGGASSPYSAGELHSRIKTASGLVELPSGILTAYNDNAWHHVAVTRNGSTASIYVDGVLRNTASISGSLNTSYGSYEAFIGAYDHGGGGLNSYFKGYVSDFRVYKGVAKYTENFIPASTNPDILPDTPSGVSGSSKLTKITKGAVNFDGSGDYLDAGAVDTAFGSSSDWTLELFIYPRTVGLTAITDPRTGDGTNHPLIWIKSTGVLYYYAGGSDRIVGTTVLATNKWHHVAAVRSGGTTTLYLDGKSEGSFSDSLNYASTTNFRIGQRYTSTAYNYNGFISNLRLVNGTALYTSRFIPPTAPLTNVTNTKLLCCQSNTQEGAAAVSPNVSGINNGIQWSRFLNPSDSFTASGRAAGFDGSTGTYSQPATNSSSITFAPPGGITYSTSVEVYTYQSNGVFTTVSDGAQSVSWTTLYQGWKTIASGGGTFTSTTLTSGNPSASDSRPTFAAVRVDGTILVDPLSPYGDASATNFNPFNTDIDTVRGQETGYATMNPLDNEGFTLSDGNLNVSNMGSSRQVHANIFVNSGKWYAEFTCKAAMNDTLFGVANNSGTSFLGSDTNSWGVISINGNRIHDQNGSGGQSSYGSSFTAGDVISVALDRDNGKWYAAKNGVYFGGGNPLTGANPAHSGLTGDLTFAVGSNSANGDVSCNFGQKPFKFPPPDGFQPLNGTTILPDKVFARPDQYFGTILYVGAGATKTFTGLNFGDVPDLVWMKNRDRASYGDGTSAHHYLYDTVRGTGTGKMLTVSTDEAEGSKSTEADLDGFVRDGFRLDAASGTDCINHSGDDFVAWCWKAGGNKGTFNKDGVGHATAAAAGLSGQSSNITINGCSIGTKQGFSIVKVTPSDNSAFIVPHGLSQQPDFLVIKNLGATQNWDIYFRGVTGSTQVFELNTNLDLTTTGVTVWNTVDSTKVSARGASFATSNNPRVVYFWHSVPGFSKFGTYEGNNSADGTYVELGFRPALIWVKNIDADANWKIIDARLDTYNPSNTSLNIDTNGAAFSNSENNTDILSNGFKLRTNHGARNASNTYVYCAWAEAPAFNLFGAQSNAR